MSACEAHDVLDGRIGFDDADRLLHGSTHGVEGGVLWTLHAAHGRAVILLREETFGHADQAEDVQRKGTDKDDQDQARMIQHP